MNLPFVSRCAPAEGTKSEARGGQRGQLAGRQWTIQGKERDSRTMERTEGTNTEARVMVYMDRCLCWSQCNTPRRNTSGRVGRSRSHYTPTTVKLRRVFLLVQNSRVSYNYLKYDEFGDWPSSAHALREIHQPRMRTRRVSLLRKVIRELYNKIKDSVCDFALLFVQFISSDFLPIQFGEISK